MATASFAAWLKNERKSRGWNVGDLSRASGVQRYTLYSIERRNRIPSAETMAALSITLNVSPARMFYAAGLLPAASFKESISEDWKYLFSKLTPEDEEELRDIAKLKIERYKTRKARV